MPEIILIIHNRDLNELETIICDAVGDLGLPDIRVVGCEQFYRRDTSYYSARFDNEGSKPETWPGWSQANFVSLDDVKVVIVHKGNFLIKQDQEFYRACRELKIPVVVVSGASSPPKFLDPEDAFIGEKWSHFELWLKVWSDLGEGALRNDVFQETVATLRFGERAESEKTRTNLGGMLGRLAACDFQIQGYLAIHGGDDTFIDTNSWAEFCEKCGILSPEEDLPRALEKTSAPRLIRPPGSDKREGFFWFDVCAEDLNGPSVFDGSYDGDVTAACRIAEREGRFGRPSLRMLSSTSGKYLRLVWNLLHSYYGPEELRKEALESIPDDWRWSPKDQTWLNSSALTNNTDKRVLELFQQAHAEYVTAGQKLAQYLGCSVEDD